MASSKLTSFAGVLGLFVEVITVAMVFLTAQSLTQLAIPRNSTASSAVRIGTALGANDLCETQSNKALDYTFVYFSYPIATDLFKKFHYMVNPGVPDYDRSILVQHLNDSYEHALNNVRSDAEWVSSPEVAAIYNASWTNHRVEYSSIPIEFRVTGSGQPFTGCSKLVPDNFCRYNSQLNISVCAYPKLAGVSSYTSMSVVVCGENHVIQAETSTLTADAVEWRSHVYAMLHWYNVQSGFILQNTFDCKTTSTLNQEYLESPQKDLDVVTVYLSYAFLVAFCTMYLTRFVLLFAGGKNVLIGHTVYNASVHGADRTTTEGKVSAAA